MGMKLDAAQLEQILAGVTIAAQIARGEEPVLTDGWTIGDARRCGFCNDWQRVAFVPLTHPNARVLRRAIDVGQALSLPAHTPTNLYYGRYLYAPTPQAD